MRYTKYIALLATLFAAVACTNFEYGVEGDLNNNVEGETEITIYGNITRFSDYEVGTRANKTPEESYVSNMALAVFPIDDAGEIGNCVNYTVRSGDNLLYTLDRSLIDESYEDKPFALYIFANLPNLPTEYDGPLDDLLNLALSDPGITRPSTGFPMIGSLGDVNRDGKAFVLMPMSGNRMELPTVGGVPTDYLNIPMNAIFAKVSFEISVAADQDVDVHDPPRFEMTGYEVHNLPSTVSFNEDNNKEAEQPVRGEAVSVTLSGIAEGGDEGGGSTIMFDFYLPERFLTPDTTADNFSYPLGDNSAKVEGYDNIPADRKKYAQRYKPLLLGDDQKATYVTIKGKYRDHHEYYHDVSYDIYLGADNYGDFNIKRNSQYINKLTIKGITSSADQAVNEGAVSIDHRVNVERSSPLIISLRRESQLDAHYEVRPLRLRIAGDNVPAGATVTVEVVDPDIATWVRLERSGSGSDYIASGTSAGKRKYFTTNLVTSALAGSTSLTFNAGELSTKENTTVWIYVDEATDMSAAQTSRTTRSATIRVTYSDASGETDEKEYKLVQNNLHKIVADSRAYYIECYEEYLYNYDSEDSYGQILEEGLQWGLNDVQLSNEHLSFSITEDNDAWKEYITEHPTLLTYDFYTLGQDGEVVTESGIQLPDEHKEFAGQHFTQVIFDHTKNNANASQKVNNKLTMAEQANGAVEYCYNRNKRNANGEVEKVEWYLPSADELEDFIVVAYGYYEEFQDNYYWTSQPAYNRNAFYYEYKEPGGWLNLGTTTVDTYVFNVYEDNTKYARATRVGYDLQPIPSGLNNEPLTKGVLPDAEKANNPDVGYFSKWHQWKRARNGNVTTDTVTDGDQYFWEFKDETDMKRRYYGFVSSNYDMTKEVINPDYDMRQDGYQLRTKKNRIRCAYRKAAN